MFTWWPRHRIVAGNYGFCLSSVCWSVISLCFHFWITTWVNWFVPKVEIWFGIANGQILVSVFDRIICPPHVHIFIFISSPEQHSWRAIVLPSPSALVQMLKFSLKFLRPHYFLTLSPIWFIFGMSVHIIQNFAQYHPHHPRSCQGHRFRIFLLKFYVKVFRTSLHFNLFITQFVITRFWIQHGLKMDPKNV